MSRYVQPFRALYRVSLYSMCNQSQVVPLSQSSFPLIASLDMRKPKVVSQSASSSAPAMTSKLKTVSDLQRLDGIR